MGCVGGKQASKATESPSSTHNTHDPVEKPSQPPQPQQQYYPNSDVNHGQPPFPHYVHPAVSIDGAAGMKPEKPHKEHDPDKPKKKKKAHDPNKPKEKKKKAVHKRNSLDGISWD